MAANPQPKPGKPAAQRKQAVQVNLYEAKTQLSSLVERAAKGEEIVIAKAGKPMARLVAEPAAQESLPPPIPWGQNLLGITFLSEDWEKDIPPEWFEDEKGDSPVSKAEAK